MGCGSVADVQQSSDACGPGLAGAAADDAREDDEQEQELALELVPEAVRRAAEAAVPGFVATRAETEREEGALHYCLEGRAVGEAVEIAVGTDARVLEIERGEDPDDE